MKIDLNCFLPREDRVGKMVQNLLYVSICFLEHCFRFFFRGMSIKFVEAAWDFPHSSSNISTAFGSFTCATRSAPVRHAFRPHLIEVLLVLSPFWGHPRRTKKPSPLPLSDNHPPSIPQYKNNIFDLEILVRSGRGLNSGH